MTHIARIRGVFDVANSQRYRAGFAPMLFQWSHAHIAHFFIAKNRAIKRGLERKNRTIKKSRYVCHGTKSLDLFCQLCKIEDHLLLLFNKLNDYQCMNGIVNLSSHRLTNTEIYVLLKGLGFCPTSGA